MESYLRVANVARFLELEKYVIHKWIGRLEPFASRPTRERSAIEFNGADLLFLESLRVLIVDAGISLEKVAQFSSQLYDAVQKPWAANGDEPLAIYRALDGQWQVGGKITGSVVTIHIPLGEIQRKTLAVLGVTGEWQQRELALGLVNASARKW